MEEKELINLISRLKTVEPDENWVILNRSRLSFRLEMEHKKDLLNKDFSVLRELFAFWGAGRSPFAWKAARGVLAGFIAMAFLGGATVWAAKQSLPGAPLYPVKIALEKARMTVSFSQEDKLNLQTEITENRLSELKQVMQTSGSSDQKREKVAQVVENIRYQLSGVNDDLSKNQTQSVRATGIIKTASKVEKSISQVKEVLPGDANQDLNKKLAELADMADKAGIQALELILKSPEQAQINKDEILASVDEKIVNAESVIKEISEKANLAIRHAKSTDLAKDSSFGKTFGNSAGDLAIDSGKTSAELPMIRAVLVKDQSDKAQELLEQAKSGLSEVKAKIAQNETQDALNGLSGVLETINLAKTVIKSAQTIIDSVESAPNLNSNAGDVKTDNNATSSVPAK